jgi:NAD(P)-dependent dehydrogenase (short-subunit alcohol dehydrogenase family)
MRRRRNPANKYYKNGAAPRSSFLIALISFVELAPWMVESFDVASMAMAAIFDDVIATNLKGTFACTKHAVPHMIKQGWGRIINMSSASILGQEGATSYASSKGGVLNMSLTWAVELAKFGITCNAIRSSAATRLTEKGRERAKQAALARHEQAPTDAELGYYKPEEAAPLVVFLASDEAGWINGQFICIDGPRLAICEHTHHAKTAIMPGGWTSELLLKHFNTAVGTPLQAYGFLTPDGRKVL